jgi:hypothetical protein
MVRRTDSAEPVLPEPATWNGPCRMHGGPARGPGQRRDSDEVSGPDGGIGGALGRYAALSLRRADDAPPNCGGGTRILPPAERQEWPP